MKNFILNNIHCKLPYLMHMLDTNTLNCWCEWVVMNAPTTLHNLHFFTPFILGTNFPQLQLVKDAGSLHHSGRSHQSCMWRAVSNIGGSQILMIRKVSQHERAQLGATRNGPKVWERLTHHTEFSFSAASTDSPSAKWTPTICTV